MRRTSPISGSEIGASQKVLVPAYSHRKAESDDEAQQRQRLAGYQRLFVCRA
jgi:hypothetical protein